MRDSIPRVNLGKAAPELYQAVTALDQLVANRLTTAGIAAGFSHLLRLRASQINGCAFCVRLHAHDALAAGETTDRVALLDAWRESAYFDDKERAALSLVEAVTLVSAGQVPEAVYAEAATSLSTDEIAAVEWLAILMAAWNRIAISSRYPVAPPRAP
jgi:AhpD family alkylhydroperoxidase